MNSPEARTSTGELIDQSAAPKPEAPATPVEGAPETYADFTVPEGSTVSKEVIGEATPIFKELRLSQESAQKLVDFYNKQAEGWQKAAIDQFNKTREGWLSEIKADKDIGQRLPAVIENIGKAKELLGPELKNQFNEMMNLTGIGDNPVFVKVLDKFATILNEPKHVAGTNPSQLGQSKDGTVTRPSLAAAMYPNLARN